MGVAAAGETASLTGESIGGAHQVLECTQAHLPRNKHQGHTLKGTIYLWKAGEVTESKSESQPSGIVPSLTPPPMQCDMGCPTLANT